MLSEINLCCITEKTPTHEGAFYWACVTVFQKAYLPVSQEPDYLPVSYSSLAEWREEEKKCTS